MNNQPSNHSFDFNQTLAFIKKNKLILSIVFVVALVGSTILAFLIPPSFRATAVIIPSNSNRMSKAILADRYSIDFMDYGSERDCEYAIQILTSASMQDSLMRHFNLCTHYGIDNTKADAVTKTRKILESKTNVKRTNYMGVSISVDDHNPVFSASMANFMADYYDTLCQRIHYARAVDADNIMRQLCDEVKADVVRLEQDPSMQGSAGAVLVADKCKELASLQTRAAQARVDRDQHIQYKFLIDSAQVPDKKFAPKRSLVILAGTLSTLALAVFVLLLLGIAKPEQQQ